ncbi:MAG: AAA family ATPase [Planctomycetaceae bacterium]
MSPRKNPPDVPHHEVRRSRYLPVIRVFVSSTFSDLKRERDALALHVWPKLEVFCQQEGFQFQAIDLRWGVSSEAGMLHRTMRICFEELRRSQEISPEPNFLILLGDRYGWRPLPEEISKHEYNQLATAAEEVVSTITGQSPQQVLNRWYRLDENYLVPTYVLQPRLKPQPGDADQTDYTDAEVWKPIEETLWRIINKAFPPEQMRGRFPDLSDPDAPLPSIVHFQASATEQEIWEGALQAPNSREHVVACVRNIPQANRDKFKTAELNDFFNVNGDAEQAEFDNDARTAQEELKKELIEKRLDKERVIHMPCNTLVRKTEEGKDDRVVVNVAEKELEQFCEQVIDQLRGIIERQMGEYWRRQKTGEETKAGSEARANRELEIEIAEHQRFAEQRGNSDLFVGRDEEDGPLAKIRAYLASDSRHPLLVHGESGCGKSALLARAFRDIPQESQPILRFIGITPRSSDIISLLRSLCQELRQRRSISEPIPTTLKELEKEFQQHLDASTADKPHILFLDALDQLSEVERGRLLTWLPFGELPEHVKIIVSCLSDRDDNDPDGEPFRVLQTRNLPEGNFVSLDALEAEDAVRLIDMWLVSTGRKMSADQKKLINSCINSRAECRQPLYLKLLAEEARQWPSWNDPEPPGRSVPALLRQLCVRLSRDENHREPIVKHALGYLAASRYGLSETELLELLFADPDFKKQLDDDSRKNKHLLPANPPRIPQALWSRLRSDLSPYLVERSAPGANVLTIHHRRVAEWIKQEYVDTVDWNPHRRLARYFEKKAKGDNADNEWETTAQRGFSECIPHYCAAKEYKTAADLLTNFPFLINKLRNGLLETAFEDYLTLRILAPSQLVESIEIWSDFFQEMGHIFRRGLEDNTCHKIFLQLATEHADNSPLTQAAEQWLAEGRCNWFWLKHIRRQQYVNRDPCRIVLEGHSSSIEGVKLLTGRRVASWSPHWTHSHISGTEMRAFSLDSGDCLNEFLLDEVDHITEVVEIGAHRLLLVTDNHLLHLFNTMNNSVENTHVGHTDQIYGAISTSPNRFVTWSKDGTLRLWETGTKESIASVQTLALGARIVDGLGLITWNNCDAHVWNPGTLDGIGSFKGPSRNGEFSCSTVLETATGDYLYCVACKGMLVATNLQTSESITVRLNRFRAPDRIQILPNGQVITWSTLDDVLCVVSLEHQCCEVALTFEKNDLLYARPLPSGNFFVVHRHSRTIEVWDTSGKRVSRTASHSVAPYSSADIEAIPVGCNRILSWVRSQNVLRVWDEINGSCELTLLGHGRRVEGAIETEYHEVVSWDSNGSLRVWETDNLLDPSACERHLGPVIGLRQLGCDCVVTYSEDGTLRTWDPESGICRNAFHGHRDWVLGVLSLDADHLLSYSKDGTLKVWNVLNGECLNTLVGHDDSISRALVLQDGRIVSASWDGTICLWGLPEESAVSVAKSHSKINGLLALDGTRVLAWGDRYGDICMWNMARLSCEAVFEGHTRLVVGVIAQANGLFVSWSRDRTIRIWDANRCKCVHVLDGHGDEIIGVTLSPDGDLVSEDLSGEVRVWNVKNGACISVIASEDANSWWDEMHARTNAVKGFHMATSDSSVVLRHRDCHSAVGIWQAGSRAYGAELSETGRIIAAEDSGKVDFLQVHYGNRRVSLDEAEEILRVTGQIPAESGGDE